MDQVEDHKIAAPATAEVCSGALGAGILLSKQESSKGTLGAETYADRTCAAPQTFNSVDEVLAADKALLDSKKEPLQAFALPAQSDNKTQDQQVQDSISGLEGQLGYKLNYLWFNDDNGKAQVFLLGQAKEADTPASQPAACVVQENIINQSLNLQENLPMGMTEIDASKIIQERKLQEGLAKEGIPVNSTPEQVKAIEEDRTARKQALDQGVRSEDQTSEQSNFIYLQKQAIDLGISQSSSAAEIKATSDDYRMQARAIGLGLSQYSTASDINTTQKRIGAAPDMPLNQQMGLPSETSSADAAAIGMQRTRDSQLVEQGIDPSIGADQIKQIQTERRNLTKPYQDALQAGNLTAEQTEAANLAMRAIAFGLPADSTAKSVDDTMALYHQQSMAVNFGLAKDASEEAIKAADERSDSLLMTQICPDK